MIERNQETIMNEEIFNNSLRKFLKQVGITSQREVEKAVLPAKMVLTLGGVSLSHEISGEIDLG
jgi:predicted transcriptional regulator